MLGQAARLADGQRTLPTGNATPADAAHDVHIRPRVVATKPAVEAAAGADVARLFPTLASSVIELMEAEEAYPFSARPGDIVEGHERPHS